MVWLSVFREGGKHYAIQWHTSFTKCKPIPNQKKGLDVNQWQTLCKPKLKTRQFQLEYLFREQSNASEIIHATQAFIYAG